MKRLKNIHKVQELVYELRIADAAVKDVLTVSPDTMMSEIRPILRSRKLTAAPVLKNGELLGIVSVEDYINWLSEGLPDCPVSERMSRDLIYLYEDEPLVDAIKNFEQYRYYEFPVISRKNGKMVGIVTKFDVIIGLLKALEIDYYKKEISEYQGIHFFNEMSADKSLLQFSFKVTCRSIELGGEVASALKRNLGYLGLHPDIIRRTSIATYEAEMNLIIYGGGGDIVVTMNNESIIVEVSDSGPGIPDTEQVLKSGYSTAPNWVRELGFGAGMGFTNIQNCAKKFDISSTVGKGTYLKIVIPLEEK